MTAVHKAAMMTCVVCGVSCGSEVTRLQEDVIIGRAIDGDTVELTDARHIRYLLVDAPEIAHSPSTTSDCFAGEAHTANASFAEGRAVTLEFDEQRFDRYGRTLAYVWCDGRMLNEVMLERGYGHFMFIAPNHRYLERLERAEQMARQARAGLWGECP